MTDKSYSALLPTSDGVNAAALVAGEAMYGAAQELPDPAAGKIVAQSSWAEDQHVDAAVEVARESWATWRNKSPRERAAALRASASTLRSNAEPLAQLVVEETGKRIAEARGEINFSAQYFEWFAEAAVMAFEEHLQTPLRRFLVNYHPVGVAAAVSPWNFPVSIPARKIAAALAAGCPVVLKPSELTPRSGLALVGLLQQHLPSGIVNVVVGDGETTTTRLVDHPDVAVVSFTGSTRVGSLVAQRAMGSLTRVILELGGMAPFVVTDDADVEQSIEALMVAKFRNNGASCIAANNVYVHESLYDPVLAGVRERVLNLRVGDPLAEATDLGPVIRGNYAERFEGLLAQAEAAGSSVTRGSEIPTRGWYSPPAIVESVTDELPLWTEELFGPLCGIRPYADVQSVIDEVNARNMGLAGYVMGRNEGAALDVARQMRVGIVGINNGAPNTPEVPFGGFGLAGIGREGGLAGMMEFMESQTLSVAR